MPVNKFGEAIQNPPHSFVIIGVDPGSASAAYTVFRFDAESQKWKITPHKLDDYSKLRDSIRFAIKTVELEHVAVFHEEPKGLAWKGRNQGVGSTIKFAEHIGVVRGLLIGLNVARYPVLPATWMRRLNCLTKGDKKITAEAARQRFPAVKIINRTADSVLIGHYGRLFLFGK